MIATHYILNPIFIYEVFIWHLGLYGSFELLLTVLSWISTMNGLHSYLFWLSGHEYVGSLCQTWLNANEHSAHKLQIGKELQLLNIKSVISPYFEY